MRVLQTIPMQATLGRVFKAIRPAESAATPAPHVLHPPARLRLAGAEDVAGLARQMEEQRLDDQATPEDTEPYRVWAVWRIVREIARHMRAAPSPVNRYDQGAPLLSLGAPLSSLMVWSDPTAENDTLRLWSDWDRPHTALPVPLHTHIADGPYSTPLAAILYRSALVPTAYQVSALGQPVNPLEVVSIPQILNDLIASDHPLLGLQTAPTQPPDPARAGSTHEVVTLAGVPLLPPPIPRIYIDSAGAVDPNYDPSLADIRCPGADPILHFYVAAFHTAANHLNLLTGTPREPRAGLRGFKHIEGAFQIRENFPDIARLVDFEQTVVDRVLTVLVGEGAAAAREVARNDYGLRHWEIDGVLRMAREALKHRYNTDVEEDRAIATARLEEIMRQAGEALDHRAQIGAIKAWAVLRGLGKTEPEDMVTIMRDVVGDHDLRSPLAPSREMPALPSVPSVPSVPSEG